MLTKKLKPGFVPPVEMLKCDSKVVSIFAVTHKPVGLEGVTTPLIHTEISQTPRESAMNAALLLNARARLTSITLMTTTLTISQRTSVLYAYVVTDSFTASAK